LQAVFLSRLERERGREQMEGRVMQLQGQAGNRMVGIVIAAPQTGFKSAPQMAKLQRATAAGLGGIITRKQQVMETIRCSAAREKVAAPQAVAIAPSVPVEENRLVPRVENRDGYWVLREEFRAGINPAEKVLCAKTLTTSNRSAVTSTCEGCKKIDKETDTIIT